ncbi:MAG: gliding motility-associated C-terminal domain-containing protein [Saprospiraceae bacterium]|nr:gliding motility-associated C-terminal domain-containing protein [Saprospiraceae bacterium]
MRVINEYLIEAPNIISTKSSEGNSTFYLSDIYGNVKIVTSLVIYDRWGNKVFEKKFLPE